MVDDPHIAPFVRVNIVVAQFLYVGIGQARKATEHEDIPHDRSFIIGNLHVHDRLQFRFGQETAVAILTRHSKSCERVRCNPAVLKGRIAHQLQFLDRSDDASRQHTPYRREVHRVLFDKVPFQLSERYIFHLIFVLQECGQIATCTGVIFERTGRTVFADTLFRKFFQVVVECLQQELIAVPESQPCVLDFLGSDITVPVADALVLLADIGLDILQLLVDALGDDALAGGFVGFGVP